MTTQSGRAGSLRLEATIGHFWIVAAADPARPLLLPIAPDSKQSERRPGEPPRCPVIRVSGSVGWRVSQPAGRDSARSAPRPSCRLALACEQDEPVDDEGGAEGESDRAEEPVAGCRGGALLAAHLG